MKRLWVLLVLLACPLATGTAEAACSCQCINGEVRAVCQYSFDPEPVCPPRFCAMPRVVPEVPPPPSAGPRKCVVKEILNDRTGKFEKREVCT